MKKNKENIKLLDEALEYFKAKEKAERVAKNAKEKSDFKKIVKKIDEINKTKKENENEEYMTVYSNIGHERLPLKTVFKKGQSIILPSAFGVTEQTTHEQEITIKINTVFPYKKNYIYKLEVIQLTGASFNAAQIGKKLGAAEEYIRGMRKKISDKIIDNHFKIDSVFTEPTDIIINFYSRYKNQIEDCLKQYHPEFLKIAGVE